MPETDDDGNPTGRKLGGLRRAYTLAGLAAVSATGDNRGTADQSDDLPGTHGIIQGTAPAGSTLTIRKSFTYSTDPRLDDDGVQAPDATITEPRSRPSWSRPAASSCGTSTRRPSRTARPRRGS